MIAVGVGVAPMIQTLRGIFKAIDRRRADCDAPTGECTDREDSGANNIHSAMEDCSVQRIVLLYGVVRYCSLLKCTTALYDIVSCCFAIISLTALLVYNFVLVQLIPFLTYSLVSLLLHSAR